jgi:hypothetical protein
MDDLATRQAILMPLIVLSILGGWVIVGLIGYQLWKFLTWLESLQTDARRQKGGDHGPD